MFYYCDDSLLTFANISHHSKAVGAKPTSREAIPDLQSVVAAENTSGGRRVRLQLKALELQNDLRHLGCEDHESAVQVIGVFLWETGRLYDTAVGGEVPGAFGTCRTDEGRKRDGK